MFNIILNYVAVELQAMVYEELSGQLHSIDHSMASSSAPLTENQLREIENLRKIVWSLNYELKAISELYHMATDPYKLWELSLKIMKVANHREAPLINKLWRSIIYK